METENTRNSNFFDVGRQRYVLTGSFGKELFEGMSFEEAMFIRYILQFADALWADTLESQITIAISARDYARTRKISVPTPEATEAYAQQLSDLLRGLFLKGVTVNWQVFVGKKKGRRIGYGSANLFICLSSTQTRNLDGIYETFFVVSLNSPFLSIYDKIDENTLVEKSEVHELFWDLVKKKLISICEQEEKL